MWMWRQYLSQYRQHKARHLEIYKMRTDKMLYITNVVITRGCNQ